MWNECIVYVQRTKRFLLQSRYSADILWWAVLCPCFREGVPENEILDPSMWHSSSCYERKRSHWTRALDRSQKGLLNSSVWMSLASELWYVYLPVLASRHLGRLWHWFRCSLPELQYVCFFMFSQLLLPYIWKALLVKAVEYNNYLLWPKLVHAKKHWFTIWCGRFLFPSVVWSFRDLARCSSCNMCTVPCSLGSLILVIKGWSTQSKKNKQ